MAVTLGSNFFKCAVGACGRVMRRCCRKKQQPALLSCNPNGVSNPTQFCDQFDNYTANWTPTITGVGSITQNPGGEPAGTVEIIAASGAGVGTNTVFLQAHGIQINPTVANYCFCFKIKQKSPAAPPLGLGDGPLGVPAVPGGSVVGLQTLVGNVPIHDIGISTVDFSNFTLVAQQPFQPFTTAIPVDGQYHTFTVCTQTNRTITVAIDNNPVQVFNPSVTNICMFPTIAVLGGLGVDTDVVIDSYCLSFSQPLGTCP